MQLPSFVRAVLIELSGRHRFRPRGGRSTNIRIECSSVYTLRCIFMARITSRDNKRFVSHGFCHCARPSLCCSGTRRFVICFAIGIMISGYRSKPTRHSNHFEARKSCCPSLNVLLPLHLSNIWKNDRWASKDILGYPSPIFRLG